MNKDSTANRTAEPATNASVTPVIEVEKVIPLLDEPTDFVTYIGYAPNGTLPTDEEWIIRRVTSECTIPDTYPDDPLTDIGTGTQTIVEYVDGNPSKKAAWSDRTTLTYIR